MAAPVVGVIDTQIANLNNVAKALTTVDAPWQFFKKPNDLLKVDKLILPGVGAFSRGIQSLQDSELGAATVEYAISGNHVLGICLGMQLLLTSSEEFGEHKGLGLVAGRARKLTPSQSGDQTHGFKLKVPHVGWSPVTFQRDEVFGIDDNEQDYFYFTHSFAVHLDKQEHVLGASDSGYGPFCSVLRKDNVYGCQFHPELSGPSGLKFLGRFCKA